MKSKPRKFLSVQSLLFPCVTILFFLSHEARAVDHFVYDSIASPQFTNIPFNVTITAVTSQGARDTNFSGSTVLSATGQSGALAVQPSTAGPFVMGVWTGTVQLLNTDRFVQLQVAAAPGASNPFHVESSPYRVIGISAMDLAYDSSRDRIYASVPNTGGIYSNSIVTIDPAAGTIISSLSVPDIVPPATFVEYRSGKLAISDDGQYLYVAVSNALAVQRCNLASQTLGLVFGVGKDQFGNPLSVADMSVIAGSPGSVVVARADGYNAKGAAVYDNGIRRSTTTPEFSVQDINVIEPSDSPNLFYGYNNQNTGFDFLRLAVNSSGISVQDTTSGLLDGFFTDMFFNGGRVFGSTGRIVDPSIPTLIGTFVPEGSWDLSHSMVTADSKLGTAFFVTPVGTNFHVQAYDIATLLPLKALDVPQDGGGTIAFFRWGTNGLAFATTAGNLYLIQTSLLFPTGNPADLVVSQTNSGQPVAGLNFTISATVSNKGPEYATGVMLNDILPTNCILVSAAVSQGTWSTNVHGISANLGFLAPNSTASVTMTLQPSYGGWFSNCVFAVANEKDPALTNNVSTQELFARINVLPNSASQFRLPISDIAYDHNSQKLVLSVPSRAGIHGNDLIALDTASWQTTDSINVGNEPGRMAQSDDGSALFVAVNSNKSICRVALPDLSVDSTFSLVSNAPSLFVEDLAVLPGQSHSVAVSRSNGASHEGVAVYDDGIQRPNTGPSESYSDIIEFGSDSSILFAHNSGSVGFSRLQIDAQGVSFLDSDPNLLGSFNGIEMKYANGLLYSSEGLVIDPLAGLLKGKIVGITASSTICFDAATHRLYFLQPDATNFVLWAFDSGSLLPLGKMEIPGVLGTPQSLTRWGADGLAFVTTGDQLFVLRTSLIPTAPPADLRLNVLSSPGAATAGNNYQFSLQITNAGPFDANHVVVSNALPPGSAVINLNASQGTYSNANGTLICDLETLTNGATATIDITIRFLQPGLFSVKSLVSADALDLTFSNNQAAWLVWCSDPAIPTAQFVSTLGVNDIVADRASGRLYASIGSAADSLANTVVWLDPVTGNAGPSISTGANPNRLAISKDSNYLYVGLDDASAVQRIDANALTTAVPFSLGSGQTAVSLAVDPKNASQVLVLRTFDNKIAAYMNGAKITNELSGMSLFAFAGSNGTPFACNGGFSGVPLYQAILDSSGLVLGPSQPTQQRATELKSDGGLLFYNGGMIVDPDARRVTEVMPVSANALVEPDVASGRVYYLTKVGSGWTLRAFDLMQGIEIGSSPITGISGNPKRMVRCGADAFAICTDAGQIVIFRSSLVPAGNATDLALSQSSSVATTTTNNNISLLLTLTNKGPATAQSLTVTQSFSLAVTNITLTASSGSASFASNIVTWQLGSLTNGGSATLSIGLRPTQTGTLQVSAAARHSNNDPSWGNNAAYSAITVTGPAGTNVIQLRLATRELVYDPFRDLIYASLPATNQFLGNLVAVISPETGNMVGSLFAGSEPDQLALSEDGHYLYATLDGTMGVRRFDLNTQSYVEFPLSLTKLYNASDLKVQPGHPLTFAVSRIVQNQSIPESVAVYDDTIPRTNAAGVTKPIVFSQDGSQIYGTLTLGAGIGFLRLQVGASGVSQLSTTSAYGGDTDFDTANGLVYGTTGRVIDPSVPTAVGTNKATGPVAVDIAAGRVFYLTQAGANFEIRACEVGSYQSLGTNAIAGVIGSPSNLIRCGGDRLAFRTTSNQVFIVRSKLVPAADLAITGTSTPSSLLAGQIINNLITLTNFGPLAATNVTVTNYYTGSASIISATQSQGSVTIGANFVVWNIGTISSNGICSLSLAEIATNTADGIMSNNFHASSSLLDPAPQNNSVTLTNSLNADNDRDGMADTWEIANGFDPSNAADALLDADGDGAINRDEYLAGTGPHDPTSSLRITGFRITGGSFSLTFSSVIGKSYVVEQLADLNTAIWTAIGIPIQGTGGDQVVPISSGSGFPCGFYRIRLVQQ